MARFGQFFLLTPLLLAITYSLAITPQTRNLDRSSLPALKSHITSDPYNIVKSNWTVKTPVCSWKGVTCGPTHNRVVELDISDMTLSGSIPPQIGNLSFLVNLNMMNNLFNGSIPVSVFNMSSLQVINLRGNSLSGSLPVDMCMKQTSLRVLDLSINMLYGEIPSSLDRCSKLEIISLGSNNFAGNVPRGIGNLTRLEQLSLDNNNLSGNLRLIFFFSY